MENLPIRELGGEQRRQLIETEQLLEVYEAADVERRRRFNGSMRWAKRGAAEYLLRKVGIKETSLGRRSVETERAFAAFFDGREKNKALLAGLSARLNGMAAINRAMGLGRLPTIAARIIRRCGEMGLLGRQLCVVGTNALFAYEARVGVHVESALVATSDIDLLYDARQMLNLAAAGNLREKGLIGLLQQIDTSFSPIGAAAFRAANRDGYLVDLIRPQGKDPLADRKRSALTDAPGDLEGAAIEGLVWLVNAPKFDAVVIDERGYPVRMITVDPRVFALHKAWLSRRQEREPLKARRDIAQSRATALLATRYLGLGFDDTALSELPAALRALAQSIVAEDGPNGLSEEPVPNW